MWNFSATLYGKSCINGIVGTFKSRLSKNIRGQCLDISTSADFAKVTESVCPNINVLHIAKEKAEIQKSKLHFLHGYS